MGLCYSSTVCEISDSLLGLEYVHLANYPHYRISLVEESIQCLAQKCTDTGNLDLGRGEGKAPEESLNRK